MEKLLFVVRDIYPKNEPNTNLVLAIIEELRCDYEISLLGNSPLKEVPVDSYSNIKTFSVKKMITSIPYTRQEISTLYKLENFTSIFKKIASLFRYPKLLVKFSFNFCKSKFDYFLYERTYIHSITKLCRNEKFSVVISVSAPYYTSTAAAKCKRIFNYKQVVYQLDPHFEDYNSPVKNKVKRLNDECLVYETAEKVLVTDLIYEENKLNQLVKYIDKMEVINFPNIKEPKVKITGNIHFAESVINCVFAGRLYQRIRNPEFLLNLLARTQNIRLHILGSGCEEIINKYKDKLNIVTYGEVSLAVATEAMQKADILINIGNTVPNQMPSKIFDYISLGKPIVNILKLEKCPTLKYLNKYPLAFNIFEEKISEKLVNELLSFCTKNKNKQLEFSLIEDLYKDMTIQAVGSHFNHIIKDVSQ